MRSVPSLAILPATLKGQVKVRAINSWLLAGKSPEPERKVQRLHMRVGSEKARGERLVSASTTEPIRPPLTPSLNKGGERNGRIPKATKE